MEQLSTGAVKIAESWASGTNKINQSLQEANRSYLVALEKSIAALPQTFTPRIDEGIKSTFNTMEGRIAQIGEDLSKRGTTLTEHLDHLSKASEQFRRLRFGGLLRVGLTCILGGLIIGLFAGGIMEHRLFANQRAPLFIFGEIEEKLKNTGATWEYLGVQGGGTCLVIHPGKEMEAWANQGDAIVRLSK